MAWTKVTMPISVGGLGVLDLLKFSRALRLRWIWFSWDTKDRPWKDMELPIHKHDLRLFNSATRVTIGNGNRASFWNSSWLQGQVPADLFPALFKHSRRNNRTVKDAMTENRWINDIDHDMTVNIISEFTQLWAMIQHVSLIQTQEDKITWLHTIDGQYSASSAYHLQFKDNATSPTAAVTWKTKAPPKCKFFVWLVLQNRVWTTTRLQLRGWPNQYFCPLCMRNLETIQHLLQECSFTKIIWDRVASWTQVNELQVQNWRHSVNLGQWYIQLAEYG